MNFKQKQFCKCLTNRYILYEILNDILPVQNQIIDPNLINNFSDIIKILKSQKKEKWKYIYINKKKINQILYNYDENINIDDTDANIFRDFEYLFYLDNLILNEEEIINYTFSKKFIDDIFINLKIVMSNNIFELVNSLKIVLYLINNYKGCDNYDEDTDEKELDDIENYCKTTINEYFYIFKDIEFEINKDKFFSISTEGLYINILNNIINSDKFDDYEYINKIANYLNLEKIHIPEKIFDELNKTLNMDHDCAKTYLIQKVEDLFNNKIINFYYFMIRYVYKIPFYFYQVELLLNTRNVIIFILRKNLDLLFYYKMKNEKNAEIIERVDYVIMNITDNKYYCDKYINKYRFGKLESILLFNKIFFFDLNKNEIKIIENALENKRMEKYEAILMNKDIKLTFEKINYRLEIINILCHQDLHIGNIFNNKKKLEKYGNKWQLIEKCIKDKKSNKLLRNIRKKLYKVIFTNKNISNQVQSIFKKDEIDYFKKENEELAKSNISAESKLMAKALDSIDYHYNHDEKFDSSSILIQSYMISGNNKSFSNTKSFSRLIKNDNLEDFKKVKDRFTKSDKYVIINHVTVIGRHRSAAEFIRQLSNGLFISGGSDNLLYIYEKTITLSKSIYIDIKEFQYNIYEVESENKQENEINLMSFSQNKINYCTLDAKDKEIKINGKLKNSSLISLYKLDKKSSLIVSLEKLAKIDNEWNLKNVNIKPIYFLDMFCRGGKILNFEFKQIEQTEKIKRIVYVFALTSNDEIPNGKNMMIFFDYEQKKISYQINHYSFVASYNNLIEVNQTINSHIKLLLVACKKKDNNNKISEINGILLIKINIKVIKKEYELKYNYDFVETESFEVSCFCQLLLVDNNNSIYDDITYEKNIIIKQTEYFLIGGFDSEKRIGCIKLYKIKKEILNEENKDNLKNKLEYLQDIDIEKNKEFQGFGGKISCITQSTITGNILVTCWDGTVHLFRPPNLDSYNSF